MNNVKKLKKDIQLDYAIKVVPNIIIKRMVLDIKLTNWEDK